MSINQYRPRRRHRHGISQKAYNFLLFLIIANILLQIAYPLSSGALLEKITIATVIAGATLMFIHGHLAYGWRYALTYLFATSLFAFAIEYVGLTTGWPFGRYSYDESLGLALGGVPLLVPLAWVMMAHPMLVVARRLSKHWVFLIGGAGLAAWDLFLDPQMVDAGRWSWEFDGRSVPFQPMIPLSNAFGWLLAGMALIALLHQILPRDRRKEPASFGAVDAYLAWTLFSGIVGNIFFFDRPGTALIGGLTMGAILIPYAFNRWFGRP